MSNLLTVRAAQDIDLIKILSGWSANHPWVKTIELADRWEPQELEINKKNAVIYLRGKHKLDIAELILILHEQGCRAFQVKLRDSNRDETELTDWAMDTVKLNRS